MTQSEGKPLTEAERTARRRRRRDESAVVIPAGSLEASAELSEALIEAGWLDGADAENPDAVAEALAELHEWWLENGTDLMPVTS